MVFEMHPALFEDYPIGVPPAIHCRLLVLQSCYDDDNRDFLPADGRVEQVVVSEKGATDPHAAYAVHQKADAIRFRARELEQKALQAFFCLSRWYCPRSPLVETHCVKQDKALARNFDLVLFITESAPSSATRCCCNLILRDCIDDRTFP